MFVRQCYVEKMLWTHVSFPSGAFCRDTSTTSSLTFKSLLATHTHIKTHIIIVHTCRAATSIKPNRYSGGSLEISVELSWTSKMKKFKWNLRFIISLWILHFSQTPQAEGIACLILWTSIICKCLFLQFLQKKKKLELSRGSSGDDHHKLAQKQYLQKITCLKVCFPVKDLKQFTFIVLRSTA